MRFPLVRWALLASTVALCTALLPLAAGQTASVLAPDGELLTAGKIRFVGTESSTSHVDTPQACYDACTNDAGCKVGSAHCLLPAALPSIQRLSGAAAAARRTGCHAQN